LAATMIGSKSFDLEIIMANDDFHYITHLSWQAIIAYLVLGNAIKDFLFKKVEFST
jgi:hypothetical protein